MNKYFSDLLPPALVRDLRRSLRTRGYLAMLTVFMLVAAWLQFDSIQEVIKELMRERHKLQEKEKIENEIKVSNFIFWLPSDI